MLSDETRSKVHLTATVLIPPESVWEPIQAIRREHDPHIDRWMPHVTMLYPFVPEPQLDEAAARLQAACSKVEPFAVCLAEFGCFVHGRKSATLWLRPDPVEKVVELQAKLQAAIPWCDDVSQYEGGFTPHLSVGWFAGRSGVEHARRRCQRDWAPIEFQLVDVCLIARSGEAGDPFRVERRVLLGG